MPIDPSIYNQIQQPKLDNPLNALAQVAQLQHFQSQNKLADLTYGEKQREIEQTNALNGVYKGAIGPDGTIDRTKLYTGVAGVAGTKLPGIQKGFADADKAAADALKVRLENGLKQFEATAQIMSGVKDQASYDQAKQQITAIVGPEHAANIPAVYDPAVIEQGRLKAMSVKDQMEQKLKEITQTETQRHNKATEGLTLSGQNKVDARSREANNAPEYKQDADGNWVALPKKPGAGPITAQAVMGPDGKPLKANKQPNEYQGKSAGYGARAEQADKIITSLEGNYSPMAINSKVSVESTPLVGGMLGAATNKFGLSANDQRAEQAQRDFINAVLRQESGASISPSEFDNARKQYFPQPGDTKEVLTQKAQNRKLAIHGFKNSAGNASFSAPAENVPATAKFLGFE